MRSYFFFLRPILFRADDIDGGGVKRGFDVHSVIFLDHANARAIVLSDLIDVSSLRQPQGDIRVGCTTYVVGLRGRSGDFPPQDRLEK